MKVKVLKQFRDKETGKLHRVGETFTCTEDRCKQILTKGDLVEKIVEKKTVAKTAAKSTKKTTAAKEE